MQEEDLLLLNAMLDKERKAEEAELAYKNVLMKQARDYQAQLVELMKKEAFVCRIRDKARALGMCL